jgi:NMD protein affecting ribosome stability and mRNA decay
MKKTQIPREFQPTGRRRSGRAQNPEIEDPYMTGKKLAEPSVCSGCGAVYHKGRWHWPELPDRSATPVLCAACHRIAEKLPAGTLTIGGAYVGIHGDEMMNLVNHQAEQEKKEHPMNRVIGVERSADKIVVTTTDIHLPRRIGRALSKAHHGKLDMNYDEDAYAVRVNWQRDE